jgi:DNA-3-methyladenine glycosylase II
MHEVIHPDNLHQICDHLSEKDADLRGIIIAHGYPPFWSREPGFETLIHIILEQQVSLASAKSALNKLKERIGVITPENLLALSDADLRSCYFSRQKTIYARTLAAAIQSRQINLKKLNSSQDDKIRSALKEMKGIGDWTVDVYLLMALHRTDIFPTGDLAMMNSLKKLKRLPAGTDRDHILKMAESWRPYRSVAAMLFWHQYIRERNIKE